MFTLTFSEKEKDLCSQKKPKNMDYWQNEVSMYLVHRCRLSWYFSPCGWPTFGTGLGFVGCSDLAQCIIKKIRFGPPY